MKLAISGKGGVGKTTLAAMVAGALAVANRSVIAIDADPDANLAAALGVPDGEPITPLANMSDLIAERAGLGKDYTGYFRLNPKVDDIPERYARKIGNIRLLVLGGMSQGGEGCLCPASALLKALLIHLALDPEQTLVMDMEAGIEHLGRATAQSMEALIVVVDPTPWSIQTALRVRKLASDIGLRKVLAVANRTNQAAQLDAIAACLQGIPLIGHLPTDDRLAAGIVRPVAGGRLEPTAALKEHLPAIERILAACGGGPARGC